jgi:hypothetical protein
LKLFQVVRLGHLQLSQCATHVKRMNSLQNAKLQSLHQRTCHRQSLGVGSRETWHRGTWPAAAPLLARLVVCDVLRSSPRLAVKPRNRPSGKPGGSAQLFGGAMFSTWFLMMPDGSMVVPAGSAESCSTKNDNEGKLVELLGPEAVRSITYEMSPRNEFR